MRYPLLDVFLTTLFFFPWIVWIMLFFRVIGDILGTVRSAAPARRVGFLACHPALPGSAGIHCRARGEMAERQERRNVRM